MLKLLTIFICISLASTNILNFDLKKFIVEVPLEPFNPDAKIILRANTKIAGGSTAYDGQFPHVNEINVSKDGHYILCTGAFLTTSWSITALHCLDQ